MSIAFMVRHGDHRLETLTTQGEGEARAAAAHIQTMIAEYGCAAQRRVIRTSHEHRAIAFGKAIGIALGIHGPHEEWEALTPAEIVHPLMREQYRDSVAQCLRSHLASRDGIPILITHSTNIALLINAFDAPSPNAVPNGMVVTFMRTEKGLRVSYFPDSIGVGTHR